MVFITFKQRIKDSVCAGDTEKVMVRYHHTLQKNVFMVYRTKAYLVGEWTGDTDAIEKISVE